MKKQKRTLLALLAVIGAISAVVSGVGVMNVMLLSVKERRHEIGIRLAVGAMPQGIFSMFLGETTLLVLIGALLGCLIGLATTWLVSAWRHWPFFFVWQGIGLGLLICTSVGIFFGCYPALCAARLNPVDALRSA